MDRLNTMAKDPAVREKWVRVYMDTEIRKDPHEDFAHLLGIERYEAKSLCYRVVFSSPFMNRVLKGGV